MGRAAGPTTLPNLAGRLWLPPGQSLFQEILRLTRLLGDLAVAAALALSLGGAVSAFWGRGASLAQTRRFAVLVFGCLSVAALSMIVALVTHDFSVGSARRRAWTGRA